MRKKIYAVFACFLAVLAFVSLLLNHCIAPTKYKRFVSFYAETYTIDTALVYSVIKAESNFNEKVVSSSGAMGLMQIMPATAEYIAGKLGEEYNKNKMFDAKENIKYGCFYLRYLFNKFENMDIVICAYNAGEGIVQNWFDGGVFDEDKILYGETRTYYRKVSEYYQIYKNKRV